MSIGAHKPKERATSVYTHGWGSVEYSNVGVATNYDIGSQIRQICVHWLLVPEAAKRKCYRMVAMEASVGKLPRKELLVNFL